MSAREVNEAALRWPGIFCLGMVQAALGAVVVLVTSTLNRVMVVEYALPALLPGALVALHYAVQLVRPRFGYCSDRGGRRTPWIIGGMALLASGGVLCSIATVLLHTHTGVGLALAIVGYAMVGIGVGAAGTSLLVLMAKRVDDRRRAAAAALDRVWRDPPTRAFTVFVFVSMLAYSAQELLLEPFSGLVFGYTLGESAKLSGSWHGAALIGMIGVGLLCGGRRRFGSLRQWLVGGCAASAAALACLGVASWVGPGWPLRLSVLALGVSNGVFAVSAIGSMMELAHDGDSGNAGVRMGLWGAAQAIVFCIEDVLFLAAAGLAVRARSGSRTSSPTSSAVTA